MHPILKYFWFLFVTIHLTTCIDEIELKIPLSEEKIIIEGLIADSLDKYSITVKRTRDKGIYPITGADVKVFSDNGQFIQFKESPINEGHYQAIMAAQTNHAYHLQVKVNEKIYESEASTPIKSPDITRSYHSVFENVYINSSGNQTTEINVQALIDIKFNQNQPKPYLRWRASGEYEFHEFTLPGSKWCYATEINDFNKLNIYDGRFLPDNSLIGQSISFTELDYRFYNLYCFHITQYTMLKKEYDYWTSLKTLIENKGTLYDPPVGNVKGNIYNKVDEEEQVIGYFSVAGTRTIKHFVYPSSLVPYFPRDPCRAFNNPLTLCTDCLKIKNSTNVKPSYWP